MIKTILLGSIRFYQKFISQFFGINCRFYPSCSEYFYQVVKREGIKKGLWKGVKRVFKCGPWHPGGVDLP